MNTNDAERSVRLNEAKTSRIHQTSPANPDRRAKRQMREIPENIEVSISTVFTILRKNLGIKMLCFKWVPHLFTIE